MNEKLNEIIDKLDNSKIKKYISKNLIILYTPDVEKYVNEFSSIMESAFSNVQKWGELKWKEITMFIFQENISDPYILNLKKQIRTFSISKKLFNNNKKLMDILPFSFFVHEAMHTIQIMNRWFPFVNWVTEGFAEFAALDAVNYKWDNFNRYHSSNFSDKKRILNLLIENNLKPFTKPQKFNSFSPITITKKYLKLPEYKFSDNDKNLIKNYYLIVYGTGLHIFLFLKDKFGENTLLKLVKSFSSCKNIDDFKFNIEKIYNIEISQIEKLWFNYMSKF